MISINYELELSYQFVPMGRYPTWKPVVAVRISAGQRYQDTAALVDSGADYSIFDAEFADALGLGLTEGRPISLIGLDGKDHIGYLHRVAIRILGDAAETLPVVKAEVIFRQNHPSEVGNILGRHDFFRALKVGFHEPKQKVYLAKV